MQRAVLWTLLLVAGAVAYLLAVSPGRSTSSAPAGHGVPTGADDTTPLAAPPSAASQEGSERAAAGEREPARDANAERERRGELRVLSREQFLVRLRELGIDPRADFFSEAHRQRPDLGSLLVLVTDTDGVTVEGARVLLSRAEARQRRGVRAFANATAETAGRDGLALFRNLAPDSYRLAVEHADYLSHTLASIAVAAGEPSYVEVTLAGSEAWIRGTVTDASLAAVAGAQVTAYHRTEGALPTRASAVSDVFGAFALRVRRGTQNVVRASKTGYREALLTSVAAGSTDIHLVVEPTRTRFVTGSVVDGATGEPVASFAIDGAAFHDPAGRFRVERNVSPYEQSLVVRADGYEPRTVAFLLRAERDVDLGALSLFSEARLSGIVVLEDGDAVAPVAGALVEITSELGEGQTTRTSDQGAFAFEAVAAARVQLRVSAPDAAPYGEDVALLEGEPTYVEVRLRRGAFSAEGRIVDDETDEPIAGARVELVGHDGVAATTGADGEYRLEGLPEAELVLRATSARYLGTDSPPLRATRDAPARWDGRLQRGGLGIRFRLAGGEAPAGVAVVLWKAVAPDLAGALAAQADLAGHRRESVTDAEGAVSFEVDDGRYFVQVPDYRLHPTLVVADAEASDWITLDLPGVTALSGSVANADGSPVANTSLWLHSGDQDYSTMYLYHTDAAGRYAIPNLAPRHYALSIVKSAADQSAQHVREVTIGGAPAQIFDVTFPPLTATLTGRLVDELGVPKPNVWIGVEYLDAPHRSILAGWVGTDTEGRFHVPRLEPGRHVVRTAWTADETVFSEVLTLAPGEERELELVAPRVAGRRVRGHVIAADGGPLGPNFLFAVDGAGHQNGNYFSTMDWAYAGSFDVGGLAPGSYRIDVTAMGCSKTSTTVDVLADVSGVVVRMERE